MLVPRKVKFEAMKRENENLEFRTFLKCNADEKELDQQFLALHNELYTSIIIKAYLKYDYKSRGTNGVYQNCKKYKRKPNSSFYC